LRNNDIDQLAATLANKRLLDLFSTFSRQIHSVRELLLPPIATY
jgi:hypothetical protein